MQQALYHPAHGYYSSGRCAIGREGDYYTSVSVGPLFGHLLAVQFSEIWERLGRVNDFVIVEQGAHDGQFAGDVLEFLHQRFPDFFDRLRYQILESFPILEQQQRLQESSPGLQAEEEGLFERGGAGSPTRISVSGWWGGGSLGFGRGFASSSAPELGLPASWAASAGCSRSAASTARGR